jgi:hypothetical protein
VLFRSQYKTVSSDVISKLKSVYKDNRIEEIRYVNSKDTFGDLDVLIEQNSDEIDSTLRSNVSALFGIDFDDKTVFKSNGNVLSFGYKLDDGGLFQVDIIRESTNIFQFSADYFAYNDLGNLLGRMMKKLGLKLGHDGLYFIVRPNFSNDIYKHILVSNKFSDALELLQVDVNKFNSGLDQLLGDLDIPLPDDDDDGPTV